MQIVWKETRHIIGVSGFAAVGSLELYVVPLVRAGRWVVEVDDAITCKQLACDDAFMGTFDEAKARAVVLGLGTLSPWVEIARAQGAAQEREKTLATISELIAQEQRIVSAARRNAETARARGNRFGVERFDTRALAAEDRIANLNKLVVAIRERKDSAP